MGVRVLLRIAVVGAVVLVSCKSPLRHCSDPGGCKPPLICYQSTNYCVLPPDAGNEDDSEDAGWRGDGGDAAAGGGTAAGNPLGTACSSGAQCGSGFCVDGVCCDSTCTGKDCQSCDATSVNGPGRCGFTEAGTECKASAVDCAGKCSLLQTTYACTGTSYVCASSQKTLPVVSGKVCDSATHAAVPVGKALYCNQGNDCADGKCQALRWWTSCDGNGKCWGANDNTDAFTEVVTAPPGASLTSACATTGTSCDNAKQCAGDSVYSGHSCNGTGACTVLSGQASCGAYTCNTSSSACKTSCSSNADCASGLLCTPAVSSACHWNWQWANWDVSLPRRLTINADNVTITDNVTGLMWQRGYSDTTLVAQSGATRPAEAYCQNLTLLGYTDWRLPSIIELLSIVDVSKIDPSIDAAFQMPSSMRYFWTSTPCAGDSSSTWFVAFLYGYTYPNSSSSEFWVRCVR